MLYSRGEVLKMWIQFRAFVLVNNTKEFFFKYSAPSLKMELGRVGGLKTAPMAHGVRGGEGTQQGAGAHSAHTPSLPLSILTTRV
jgi:hypothetical protein